MKRAHHLALLIIALLTCAPVPCDAKPSTPPMSTSSASPEAAKDILAGQMGINASLWPHASPWVLLPEICVLLKNNSTRYVGYVGTGSNYSFTMDFLPEGKNPAGWESWTLLKPRESVGSQGPASGAKLSTGMNAAFLMEPGKTQPFEIRPDDFGPIGVGLVTPGYYWITVTFTLERALTCDDMHYSGVVRLGDVTLPPASLIIHRTATTFESWPLPAVAK